jgi:hypothetical protein
MGALIKFVGAPGANLPPQRAELARCLHEIGSTDAQLNRLRTGAARLRSELAVVDAGRRELEALVEADAQNLVTRLKGGLDWALNRIAGARAHTAAARLGGSAVENAVAETALVSVNREIERLEAHLESLTARKAGLVLAAARESATGLFDDYAILADRLRETMVQLRGLERLLGVQRHGRMIATIPDFHWAEGLPETVVVAGQPQIEKSTAAWRRFAQALEADPAADVERLLEFDPVDPTPDENTIYSELTQTERSRIDHRFAASPNN